MITNRAGYFIKGTDAGVAAFDKGTVQPRPVNTRLTGGMEHASRSCSKPQGVSEQTGVGIIFRFFYGSLYKSLNIFFGF